MEELENDPDNPCFGCGPKTPGGLHLKFFKAGDEVVAETTFGDSFSAWPGQVHGGIVFAALECTCQWTYYTLKHRSGPTEKWRMEFVGRVAVGASAKLVGKVVKKSPHMVSVHAELRQGGTLRAYMDQDLLVVKSLAEFKKLRPAVEINKVMKRNFESTPSS